MRLLYEIEYIRKSDGESVHSDICAFPLESRVPKFLEECMKELVEMADFSKPWRLGGPGVCEEHSEAPCKSQS